MYLMRRRLRGAASNGFAVPRSGPCAVFGRASSAGPPGTRRGTSSCSPAEEDPTACDFLNPFCSSRLSPPRNMDIEVSFPGGKRVDAQVGEFAIRTDQPEALGGAGTAPTPYDLFLASLATCAGIYVLGFCQ